MKRSYARCAMRSRIDCALSVVVVASLLRARETFGAEVVAAVVLDFTVEVFGVLVAIVSPSRPPAANTPLSRRNVYGGIAREAQVLRATCFAAVTKRRPRRATRSCARW